MNLSIKGVPDQVAARLRARADRNHRSLQGELMAIINTAVTDVDQSAGAAPAASPQGLPRTRRGWKSITQIAAEGRERHPKSLTRFGRSVDLIRQMRDSR